MHPPASPSLVANSCSPVVCSPASSGACASGLAQTSQVKQRGNTSVTARLLVLSESYREEDALVRLALHLCRCSGALSHNGARRNNRRPARVLVPEVVPSKTGRVAVRHLGHLRGGSARCRCRCQSCRRRRCRCCHGGRVSLTPSPPRSCHKTNLPSSRPPHGYRVKNGAFRCCSKVPTCPRRSRPFHTFS